MQPGNFDSRVLWFGGVLYRGQFDPRPLFVSLMPFTADTITIMLVSMVMLIHSKVSSVSYFIAPENKLTDLYIIIVGVILIVNVLLTCKVFC